MKKILIPTDFSDYASYATDVAIKLAKQTGGELFFLHMMGIPPDWIGMDLTEDKMYASVNDSVKKANLKLDQLVKEAEDEGVKATKFLQYHVGFQDILDYIKSINIDLVVMGSHGTGGLGDFMVGSTTEKMARICPVPLLVVSHPNESFDVRNIVYALDLHADRNSFNGLVHNFARRVGAKVHGLYVNTPYYFMDSPQSIQKAEEFCSDDPEVLDSFTTYNFKTEEEGILHFCKKLNADMVVMVTSGRKGFSRALHRSIAESVIRYSTIPVLSLNNAA